MLLMKKNNLIKEELKMKDFLKDSLIVTVEENKKIIGSFFN